MTIIIVGVFRFFEKTLKSWHCKNYSTRTARLILKCLGQTAIQNELWKNHIFLNS